MRPQQRRERTIAIGGLLLVLLAGIAATGAATGSPLERPGNAAGDSPGLVLEEPAHAWVPGDVFSLHGVDQYRYIIVYTRDTVDGIVHGCYEVEQDGAGRYVVTRYVHGQEVFGDAFIAEQGGRFLVNVPLDQVLITDDTPVDGGKTYFGQTLGSIYGSQPAPSPTPTPVPTSTAAPRPTSIQTPRPIPSAPHWPSLTTTPAPVTTRPTIEPPPVVTVTLPPSPQPSIPPEVSPFPMPTVTQMNPVPIVTEPASIVTPTPGYEPGSPAPVLEPSPEPTVTAEPTRAWGRRFAVWQAPSITGQRVSAVTTPAITVTPAGKPSRTVRPFARYYPPWYWFSLRLPA